MTLILQFDHSKNFQLEAIQSTVGLFEGQIKPEKSFIDFVDGVVPNKLSITENEILDNLKNIQKKNRITVSEKLDGMNFSIEMETGTGKTYVYLRTIYELNKLYNFKKFIIIVPSVAIREGVKKNFEITRKDFAVLYDKVSIDCKEYSSKDLNYVRQFSNSNKIEIMIITRDSFNKDINVMNISQDKFYGKKPIELIQKSNPILILDEPQNMESEISKNAIVNLNPLFTLRYSATHKDPYNLIYRLTPVDAYLQGLVKKIQVLAVKEDIDPNSVHIECLDIKFGTKIQAKLKVTKKLKEKFTENTILVKNGDDLYLKTDNKEYEKFIVTEINGARGYVRFSNGVTVNLGQKLGGENKDLQREQIHQTILNHFYAQKELKKKGIKVLSLFFIDKVSNYMNDGPLQKIFDAEFNVLKKDFEDFKNLQSSDVKDAYFSVMKTDKSIENDSESFERIMKNKEKLLSFDDKVCFIFSHSALREGWDNPNVFNICTLNQSESKIRKRQEIGRGLRLPVDQTGKQILDMQYSLTVVANESYAEYVKSLQNEYEEDYGYPGAAPKISNVKDRVLIKLNKNNQSSKECTELWNKISIRTEYSTVINSEKLIQECISAINDNVKADSLKIKIDTISIDLQQKDDAIQLSWKTIGQAEKEVERHHSIDNIVEELTENSKLTRSTILKILLGLPNLDLIFKNPEEFIMSVSEIIKNILHKYMVEDIQYTSLNKRWSIFQFTETLSSLDRIVKTDKSIFDKIEYQSEFEKEIVNFLNDDNNKVKFYLKMPRWFTIDTPIGTYNPDWAIVQEKINPQGQYVKTLYFIVETKATKDQDLRPHEKMKIKCGKRHFETLDVPFKVVKTIEEMGNVSGSM